MRTGWIGEDRRPDARENLLGIALPNAGNESDATNRDRTVAAEGVSQLVASREDPSLYRRVEADEHYHQG